MAPECMAERTYSEKSDVWAYGVVLFEIATGLEPFAGTDLLQVAVAVRDTEYNVLSHAGKEAIEVIPPYMLTMMQSCFQRDPKQRPSFSQVVRDLEDAAPRGYQEATGDDEADAGETEKKKRHSRKKGTHEHELAKTNYGKMDE